MSKTITLRLSDEDYQRFSLAAQTTKRPISNLINFLAIQKLEEDIFADSIEMGEILSNTALLKRLKRGTKQVQEKKGSFVDGL